ncbi:unnamed protein product [Dovyalis caffra]|uniref:Uncharacterized protein n=1 Tax=Dovyalis caffra TaxID=77055 RepID=A0AAV1R8B7_9ROSI|nr:unnamed protein product [Dovyalis caffra]
MTHEIHRIITGRQNNHQSITPTAKSSYLHQEQQLSNYQRQYQNNNLIREHKEHTDKAPVMDMYTSQKIANTS